MPLGTSQALPVAKESIRESWEIPILYRGVGVGPAQYCPYKPQQADDEQHTPLREMSKPWVVCLLTLKHQELWATI